MRRTFAKETAGLRQGLWAVAKGRGFATQLNEVG